MDNVFERVRKIVSRELYVDPGEVTRDARFRGDRLYADNLDLINLFVALVSEFDVEIKDDEMKKVITVGDMVSYIESAGMMV